MDSNINGLAWSIVTFGLLVGIGIVVLSKFGETTGGTANTSVQYVITQLGSSGLAGWIPAIIALAIGLYFLYSFWGKGTRKA